MNVSPTVTVVSEGCTVTLTAPARDGNAAHARQASAAHNHDRDGWDLCMMSSFLAKVRVEAATAGGKEYPPPAAVPLAT
jgi:hypothetical protein